MATQRLIWMDAVRGLCIFLVILVHASGVIDDMGLSYSRALETFNLFMEPFRIPLLMFLSGMLLHKGLQKPANAYFFGKFALIFWPFLVWSMVVYAAEGRLTLEYILKTAITAPSVLWFLWFIAAYYVLAYILLQKLKLPAWPIILACLVGAAVLPEIVRIPRFSYLFAFFLMGHVTMTSGVRLTGLKGAAAGLIGLGLAITGGLMAVQDLGGKYDPLYAWIPLGLVAFIFWASQAYSGAKALQPIEYVGRNSLVFYVVHFPVILVVANLMGALEVENGNLVYAVMVAAVLGLSVLLHTLREAHVGVRALFDYRAVQSFARSGRPS